MAWKLYVADQARGEIMEIWQYGYDSFGQRVADDYDALIQQALRDLKENPYRSGAHPVKGRSDGLYAYRLEHSTERSEGRIKEPSHAVFYFTFTVEEKIVAVVSVSREIRERHLGRIDRTEIARETEAREHG